jgi:hypothetical protein
MDSGIRPPQQTWLTTGKLVARPLLNDPDARPIAASGARPEGEISSLMDRVFAFLDRYPLTGGSTPSGC